MPTTTLNNNALCRNNDYVLISFNDHSKKYSHLLLFLLPTVPQLNGMEPCWIWMRVCSVTACRQLFGLKPYFLWFWEPVEPFFFFFFLSLWLLQMSWRCCLLRQWEALKYGARQVSESNGRQVQLSLVVSRYHKFKRISSNSVEFCLQILYNRGQKQLVVNTKMITSVASKCIKSNNICW